MYIPSVAVARLRWPVYTHKHQLYHLQYHPWVSLLPQIINVLTVIFSPSVNHLDRFSIITALFLYQNSNQFIFEILSSFDFLIQSDLADKSNAEIHAQLFPLISNNIHDLAASLEIPSAFRYIWAAFAYVWTSYLWVLYTFNSTIHSTLLYLCGCFSF